MSVNTKKASATIQREGGDCEDVCVCRQCRGGRMRIELKYENQGTCQQKQEIQALSQIGRV